MRTIVTNKLLLARSYKDSWTHLLDVIVIREISTSTPGYFRVAQLGMFSQLSGGLLRAKQKTSWVQLPRLLTANPLRSEMPLPTQWGRAETSPWEAAGVCDEAQHQPTASGIITWVQPTSSPVLGSLSEAALYGQLSGFENVNLLKKWAYF